MTQHQTKVPARPRPPPKPAQPVVHIISGPAVLVTPAAAMAAQLHDVREEMRVLEVLFASRAGELQDDCVPVSTLSAVKKGIYDRKTIINWVLARLIPGRRDGRRRWLASESGVDARVRRLRGEV